MAIPLPLDPDPSMTTTAQAVVAEQNQPKPVQPEISKAKKKLFEDFKNRVQSCKTYRKKLISTWTSNIDYRRGKPFASQTDEDRITVPLDWSLTKSKQAALFSQIPQIRVDHHPQTVDAGPWLSSFERKVNDTLVQAGIEAAMDEALPDCINAAGIGVVYVSYDSITEPTEVPAIDVQSSFPPEVAQQVMESQTLPDGSPLPMISVPKVIDKKYSANRISPADLLWPVNFTGADFDNAPWLGRSGRVTWAEAVRLFNLTEEDKDSVLGEDRTTQDRLTHDTDKDKIAADDQVSFDELFYKERQYDEEAKSFSTIHHLVFVSGKDEPVIDEPWKGQKFEAESNSVLGATKFPIRVLSLTYITDETIPPSDSAIGRPQINEINKSRTQMILQRERSLPVRWFDTNRVDLAIAQGLMRGTWQAMIPVQGAGDHILGEVARASMPQENFAFDKVAKDDLKENWSIGPNQLGAGTGVDTKGEAQIIESNFQTRIGRERAKVAKFFVSIAEVLGGLICLYEDPSSLGEGFDPAISKVLAYSILADSTVLVDANQRLQKLMNFINFTAKSGWVDIGPVIKEIATLSGLDPSIVVKPPQPKPPVEPNISLRLTGTEDMMNPLTLAVLMKSGQAPPPELIEQAKQLIVQALTPLPPAPPQIPGQDGPPPVMPPMPAPPGVGEAHPTWEAMPRLNKRADGESGGY